MRLITTIAEMRTASERSAMRRIVDLVPTMGALHEGHLSLVRAARAKSNVVVVSIFVNPTQFGPKEDFSKYPRNLERDLALLEQENVDIVFAPAAEEMYSPGAGANTWVTVKGMSDRLCGHSRPGHFRGVTTIVAKLFNIVAPTIAFFGQKDAAQVAIIRRMVRDLNFSVTIEVGPIVREPDGLAMSSRNAYLTPEQRKSALVLYRSLQRTQELFHRGERDAAKLIAAGKQEFEKEPAARLDYFEIVDPDSLEPISTISQSSLIAVAAFIGNTRLIDNLVVSPER
ncbi:MAG TPA: pantoate--beta-alanine ligase [Terriglobales bacterium]|nr:pantoate--beta-alanine ligase [Terriglobales bacterium]